VILLVAPLARQNHRSTPPVIVALVATQVFEVSHAPPQDADLIHAIVVSLIGDAIFAVLFVVSTLASLQAVFAASGEPITGTLILVEEFAGGRQRFGMLGIRAVLKSHASIMEA
jgi:hypothetical protein